jgi:predicted transcriptional regulator
MKRITTTVDPAVYRRLDEIARHEGVPTARLVREAMERYVTAREAAMTPAPLPEWVGMLEGGDGRPWAEHDEARLEAGWAEDLEGEAAARPPSE